jgi:predicted nuclease of predicted toxin-antitoxin system
VSGSGGPSLKLLLDQGLPAEAASLFRELGYECSHVSESGMQRAKDEEILNFARDNGSVVVTLDADFHALIAVGGLSTPSVVRLRREGCRAEMAVGILSPVLERYRVDLTRGALISVKEHRVTCHRLPVAGGTRSPN